VHGDPDELRRLVRNLLENSRRHAFSTIRVRLSADDIGTRLDVIDDGPGAPAHARDRLFDRFYSADTARPRGHGSGLGLAIARQIAARHGGTLRVVDDGHPGAHFELVLPPEPPRT
jgi:signal transduction histidine kinase